MWYGILFCYSLFFRHRKLNHKILCGIFSCCQWQCAYNVWMRSCSRNKKKYLSITHLVWLWPNAEQHRVYRKKLLFFSYMFLWVANEMFYVLRMTLQSKNFYNISVKMSANQTQKKIQWRRQKAYMQRAHI